MDYGQLPTPETAFPPISRHSRSTVSTPWSISGAAGKPTTHEDVIMSGIRPESRNPRSIPGIVPDSFYPFIRPDSRSNIKMMIKRSEIHKGDDFSGGTASLVMLTEVEIMHYWSTLKRKLDFSQSKIRQIRRSSGWIAYVQVASAMEITLMNTAHRTLKGEIDLDGLGNRLLQACPQYNMTRPRFLTILHEIFEFKIAASIQGQKKALTQEDIKNMASVLDNEALFVEEEDIEDQAGDESLAGSDESSWTASITNESLQTKPGEEKSMPGNKPREDHLLDTKLLMACNALYSGFELDGTNSLDWRSILCRLRIILFPDDSPSASYDFAFRCFTEEKRSSRKLDPYLTVDEACSLFTLFVGTEGAEREIESLAKKAFDALPTVLKRTVDDVYVVTRGLFLELMSTDPLKPLFLQMPNYRQGVFLYKVEHEMYHRAVKQKLRSVRKSYDDTVKLDRFVRKWQNLRCHKVVYTWKHWYRRRKRIRQLIIPCAMRYAKVNTVICMRAFKIVAVRHAGALWVQRVWRGHKYGRECARYARLCIYMAIRVQRMYRKRLGWQKIMARIRWKKRMATKIQKIARGFIARIMFRQMILEHYIKKRAQIEAERRMLKIRQMQNGAILIQSIVRAKIIDYNILQQRKLEVKAEQMAREMDRQKESEAQRFFTLYKQQVIDYWKNFKSDQDEQLERERKFFQQKYEIKLLRAHNRWRIQTETKTAENTEKAEIEATQWTEWEYEWQCKADKAAEAEESRIIGLCEGRGGNTKRDKEDGKIAKTFVSNYVFDIMNKFRNAGVNLSRDEAKLKAYEAVRAKFNERMRAEVAESQAADKLQIISDQQKEEEKRQREITIEEKKEKTKAAITLQSHWRKRRAQDELKKRLLRFFQKKFSLEYLCYYYEHRVSEIQFWKKPQIFGMFDLPLPKSWHFFEGDDATQCYYVQPASGSVAWAMPEGCVPCENHSQRFAAYYCQDCGIMLCDECNNGNISMKKVVHLEHNKLPVIPGVPLVVPEVACSACNMLEPVGRCRECGTLYCESCFRVYHENEEWTDYHGHHLDDLL